MGITRIQSNWINMYDVIVIYLLVGLVVTSESLFKVCKLLFSGAPEGKKYRTAWKEIVAESHMPVAFAVFFTVFVGVIQIILRIFLWPVTVVALYMKHNKD